MAVKNVIYKGRQFEVDQVPDEAKKVFALLQAAADQINKAQASIALAETARAVLSQKLDALLAEVPSSEPSQN